MIYRFEELEIDMREMVVRLGGESLPLKPRPFALLGYLVENRDRIVSKTEIMDAVWDGRAVSDAALTTAVRDIRRAIGDENSTDSLIRTFYGRGLRFMALDDADVTQIVTEPAVESRTRPSTVAILPLDFLSSDLESKLVAESVADSVIAQTSKFGLIRVLARNSAFSLHGQGLTVKDIGERLTADYIVEGSLRQLSTGARITTQLIEVASETHVWTDSFDLSSFHLYDGQEDIATTIATSVITLIYEHECKRAQARAFDDLTAWEAYCLGYAAVCTLDHRKQDEAVRMLERAIELEPTFTEAYATLAYAYCVQYRAIRGSPEESTLTGRMSPHRLKALQLAQRAIALDARIPFAWVALARCLEALGEIDNAISAAQKALRINRNLGWAHILLGRCYLLKNQPDNALEAFERGERTSPQDSLRLVIICGKALAYILLDQHEKAVAASRLAQLMPNAGLMAHLGEVCALGHLGEKDAAAEAILRARIPEPEFGPDLVDQEYPMPDPVARRKIMKGLRLAGLMETPEMGNA
ncbi:MAG: winged helix-turn-helix domain-containing tetratricopeptide repeat protein [Paracoccaceae bacterium]